MSLTIELELKNNDSKQNHKIIDEISSIAAAATSVFHGSKSLFSTTPRRKPISPSAGTNSFDDIIQPKPTPRSHTHQNEYDSFDFDLMEVMDEEWPEDYETGSI